MHELDTSYSLPIFHVSIYKNTLFFVFEEQIVIDRFLKVLNEQKALEMKKFLAVTFSMSQIHYQTFFFFLAHN